MDKLLQQVIDEQVQIGEAVIVKINGVDCIQFADESEPIPLTDLAYNQEIGLYQKSKFPELKEA